ncbi:hypothetical protein B484DRAFT_172772 [Ochromonadaceae sp. CCMP2298]|nr:hypothetical protein B484DRAFT_172772 [Ochromonadaceae sp. CCMP2298]
MARRPAMVCSCMSALILLIVVVVVATGMSTISDGSQYDWSIANTEESRNSDALKDAQDQADPKGSTGVGTREEQFDQKMYFLYETQDGGDLYTAPHLQSLCTVESTVAQDPDFLTFCLLKDGQCQIPSSSVVQYFYQFESLGAWNCSLLNETDVQSKRDVLYEAMLTPEGQASYGIWLDKGSPQRGYSTKAESVWYLGAPLEGYNSTTDDEEKQVEKYRKFLTTTDGSVGGVEETLFTLFSMQTNEDNTLPYYPSPYMAKADTEGVKVMWYGGLWSSNESQRLIASDLTFAIFSILFVLFWIRVHTGHSFTALMGIFMIFTSIPMSIFIYKVVFQVLLYVI